MIFALGLKKPILFCMLNEQDVNDMRGGRTRFVDERQLEGKTFTGVIISLHKTNEEAVEVIRSAGYDPYSIPLVEPQPRVPVEARCVGCKGIMDAITLLDGKCPMCWREMALLYKRTIEQMTGGET